MSCLSGTWTKIAFGCAVFATMYCLPVTTGAIRRACGSKSMLATQLTVPLRRTKWTPFGAGMSKNRRCTASKSIDFAISSSKVCRSAGASCQVRQLKISNVEILGRSSCSVWIFPCASNCNSFGFSSGCSAGFALGSGGEALACHGGCGHARPAKAADESPPAA